MKFSKSLLITLLAIFGLTGCYTQLEYGQRMRRITDRPVERYARDNGSERSADSIYDETGEEVYGSYEDEGYIPVYYKDYEVAGWWNSCNCNPYSGYSYGSSYYYDDPWYDGYGYGSWYHNRWRWHHNFHFGYASYYDPFYTTHWGHFGFGFHHRHHYNSFALGFYWGSPYYHSFIYGPYWDYYYYRPYWYGSSWTYWGGYGNIGHGGSDGAVRSSRTYRPRSIGTNRVSVDNRNDGRTRTRSVNRTSTSSEENRSIRSRGATDVNRGAIHRDNGRRDHGRSAVRNSGTRGASRANISRNNGRDNNERNDRAIQQRSQNNENRSHYGRTRGVQRIDRDQPNNHGQQVREARIRNHQQQINAAVRTDRSSIESHIRRQRVSQPDNSRSSIFGRVKKFFEVDNDRFNRSRNNSSVRSSNHSFDRSSRSNGVRISRPSSPDRPSVTRSRSSSSSSRSRGTSGRSRSSSSRSRGN